MEVYSQGKSISLNEAYFQISVHRTGAINSKSLDNDLHTPHLEANPTEKKNTIPCCRAIARVRIQTLQANPM